MKPVQYKMSSGTTYVGFPGESTEQNMFPLYGACAVTFMASKNYYDVRGVMTSTYAIDLNMSLVQVRQEVVDDTDSALAYCNYLGTLLATLKDPNIEDKSGYLKTEQFEEYIRHMDPLFMKHSQGVDITLSGKYEYAIYCDDKEKAKEYHQQILKIQQNFKNKSLTATEETPCQAKVVHLQFGGKGNASEKSED